MTRKGFMLWLAAACLALAGCGGQTQSGSLKIYVDGGGFGDTAAMAAAFQERFPQVEVEVETLPQVELTYDADFTPSIDTDSMAAREAALQQHRTALMAGSSDGDLYLITGGVSQYHEMNGGALVQDPYDLMSRGVLADLSRALEGLDPEEYMDGLFQAGQRDGGQYLVPLRVGLSGICVNMDASPRFPADREAFCQALEEVYGRELASMGQSVCSWPLTAMSYPVVNKPEKTIALYDENYTAGFQAARRLKTRMEEYPAEKKDVVQLLLEGRTLIQPGSVFGNLSVAATHLMAAGQTANLGYIPYPDEGGGVTAEVEVYAFAPASARNLDASAAFLQFLLSETAQDGTVPVYSMLVGYPARKGCAKALFQNSPTAYVLDYVGDSALESLTSLENRISTVRFSTHYDLELMEAVNRWIAGEGDLEEDLDNMYDAWALYLDE